MYCYLGIRDLDEEDVTNKIKHLRLNAINAKRACKQYQAEAAF